jgi:hypothetical protein
VAGGGGVAEELLLACPLEGLVSTRATLRRGAGAPRRRPSTLKSSSIAGQ